MTAWKKDKPPVGFGFFFRVFAVFALTMDFKFLVKPKKKPCSITPQERANQYPGSSMQMTISYFVQLVMCKMCKKYEKRKKALNTLIQLMILTSNCFKKHLLIRLIN